jgi:hypothetical protein
MKPRFLTDQDFNDHIVRGVLREESLVEFIRAREVGLDRSDDRDLLQYAAKHGLIVLSHDVNTLRGHAEERVRLGQTMTGLLLVSQHEPIGPIIDNLILIWSASEAEEYVNQIRFLHF